MFIYFLTLLISFAFNLLSRYTKEKNRIMAKIYFVVGMAIPITVCGIRYGVGTDFFEYKNWFLYYSNTDNIFQTSEFCFIMFINILKIFTQNPQILFIVSSFAINILVMKFIKNNTKYYELGYYLFIALYLYFSSFNIMRQWIAIAIVLLSLKYAYNKKFLKFMFYILFATSFHSTAIFITPIYFIINKKMKIRNFVIFLVLYVILIIGLEQILNLIGSASTIDTSKYLDYLNTDSGFGGNGYAYTIIGLLILFIIILNKEKYFKSNLYGEQHLKILIVAIIFSVLGINNFIFSRIQLYLIPIFVVCIPNLLYVIKKEQRKFVYIFILLFGILYLYRCLSINGGNVLPYYSIFNYE